MAVVADITCVVCGLVRHEVVDYQQMFGPKPTCQECRSKIKDKKERQFLSGLKGLTVEERLERIEKILYDLGENPKREITY